MLNLMAPAKINWSLRVLSKRPDGYHNILSLMQCIGLYDHLLFDDSDGIELVTDMDMPVEDNLVFKAARELVEFAGVKKGARIILEKEIPTGAGLGGGSSDAAFTLIGLNKFWALGLGDEDLKEIGGRLGSDVPFFFDRPTAIAEGRGESLTRANISRSYSLLLVKPPVSIPTAWAYETLGHKTGVRESPGPPSDIVELTKTGNNVNNIKLILNALNSHDFPVLGSLVHNDFEKVVMDRYPVVGGIKEGLLEAGAAMAIMSGSGSVVFGLFEDREAAFNASLRFLPFWHRVVETLATS